MKMSVQNSSPRRFRFSARIVTFLVLALVAGGLAAHNLQTRMTYMFFDPDTQACLDARIDNEPLPAGCTALPPEWVPGDPLMQIGDELGIIIKVVPRDGTTTGVGGHIDFYVPDGVQVVDVGYMVPDGEGGFEKVAMKGQSLIAVGAGPVGAKVTSQLIGLADTYTSTASGIATTAVDPATGLHRGTVAGVYGDTGIFFSTDPDTSYGSWQRFTGDWITGDVTTNSCGSTAFGLPKNGKTIVNNSGDTIVPCNKWDAEQLMAWGAKGGTFGASAPIVDYGDGRGNAPWGFASGVAGPQSGYAWHFDWDAFVFGGVPAASTAPDSPYAIKMRAAMSTDKIGPWKRIRYDGSQVSFDQPGLISSVIGYASKDAGSLGVPVSALPPTAAQDDGISPNAIRWAVGQLTAFRAEYAWVKVKITSSAAGLSDAQGCPYARGDTFGGDAGGTDNGKDHLWRYYEPTEVRMSLCAAVGKPASEEIVTSGTVFQYPVKVYNLQKFPLTNVVVRDTLGSGLTFLSSVPAQNTGPNPLVWNVGTLLPGQKFEALVTVRASSSGFLDNCVVMSSDQLPPESACDMTISGSYPFLVPTKTTSSTGIAPGGTVIYDILVRNIGTGATGSPVTVREFLPAGFTYDPTFPPVVRINGALITPTINATNPAAPVFTVPASLQPGNDLTITFQAKSAPDIAPGEYCNTYSVTQNGVPITTGSAACVTVAGGTIGDTIWRDWNGDGVQDAGEEGIAGVTVELRDGVCTPGSNCPIATTDADGKYFFPGLLAGTYTVVVTDTGGVLANTTQTGDPDSSCPSGGCDNAHTVILDTDEQYMDADFGYQPVGTGVIGDTVFEDIGNDGVYTNGTDIGISGVTVYLYEDTDGDGVITPGIDVLVATELTDGNGNYSFTGLAEGFDYIVFVDPTDAALAAYFGADPYQTSTGNNEVVADLTGTYNDADFGFWRVEPASIGDQVFLDDNGNGIFDAGDTPLAGVIVNLFRDGVLIASTVTGPDGTYLFDNLGPGTYSVQVDAASAGVPDGYASSINNYNITVAAGEDYLLADFPFVPLISKSVDKAYVDPNGTVAERTLTFSVNVNYPGSELLSDVTVRDFVPAGTTFSAAGQGGTLETFASIPGTPGINPFGATEALVYGFQGGSTAFWAYDRAAGPTGTWSTLPSAPGTITTGSALANDGERYVYAFQGGSRAFYRYDAVTRIWSDAAVLDLPAGAAVTGAGASLRFLDGYIYALIGGGSQQFWRYDVAGNSWTAMATTPNTVLVGASLATDGENLYALRGDGNNFWRYNVAINTWTSGLANIGQNVGAGSGMVFAADGFLYATTGGGQNRIYRYDIDANSWVQGTNSLSPNTGGDLVTDGTNFYVTQGNSTTTFVQRFYGAADVTLAPTPAAVTAGGALTYLESPADISFNTITASPDYVALGDPFTVVMTLESTLAALGVVPSTLTVNGGSATCTGPTPASLDLAANTPAAVTWSCVAHGLGEYSFSASASNGAVHFVSATSNSVLVSPEGQNQYVVWNLGSNDPGTTGVSATNQYFYGFQGGTVNFWAYNVPTSLWNNPLDPTNSPVSIANGGALTNDGAQYIYALQGGTRVFMRYDAIADTWNNVGITDLPGTTANVVGPGGALAYLNGYVYALIGNATNQLWRYDVAANSWSQMTNAPANIGEGGALTTDGINLFALRGAGQKAFYRYNVATNNWTTLAAVNNNVKRGGALVYANGAIYAFRGDAKKNFWRYNFAANTWTRLADAPQNVRQGGALGFDGTRIYAFRGDGKPDFWSYNIGTNTWSITPPPNAPANVNWGGALTYLPTGAVSLTRASASKSLISGTSQVAVRMTVTADAAINNVTATPTSPTYTATGGATATFTGPTLVSPDNNISGTGDPVIYEWIATVTAGANPGEIVFTVESVLNGQPGATADSNSVIVTPTLTFTAIVDLGTTLPLIENTALFNDTSLTIQNVPSNITQTATTGSIGDRVWADLDGDGLQDAGEVGLAGVQVCVYASDGVTLIGCDITDAFGNYRVFGLVAGDYIVRTDPTTYPVGYLPTTAGTLAVTLASGQQYDTADFGLSPPPPNPGSIGDYVWLDANNDGIQDDDEQPLAGITMILERLLGGVWTQVATTVTGADGSYLFDGLSAGDYRVSVDPASQVISPYAEGTFDLGDVMAPTTGTTSPSATISLSEGENYTLADFGYNWSGSIGDLVWWDYNANGLQDETPIEGVFEARVQLYFDADGDGVFSPLNGDYEIMRVFADEFGFYQFVNLPPGNYIVDVYEDSITTDGNRDVVPTTVDQLPVTLSPGNMVVDTADFGYFTGARVAGTVFHDDDRNGLFESGNGEDGLAGILVTLTGTDTFGNPVTRTVLTDANGEFVFIVPEGNYTVSYDTAGTALAGYPDATTATSASFFAQAGEDWYSNNRFDFGVDYAGAIGDRVWNDANNDGVQDAGEVGIPGVTVELYASDGITWLASTVTDANGNYLFPGLADGNYVVKVAPTTLPDDFTQTYDNSGAQDDHTGTATVSGGGAFLDADFGYYTPGYTVSGTLWNDANGDGLIDVGEVFIAGVTVCLVNNQGVTVACTVTDANGDYSFPGTPNGDYEIRVVSGTLPSPALVPTYDPDGINTPHVTSVIVNGANVVDQDFGYQGNFGSISGTVCDGDGDGLCDAVGDAPLAGVTVFLIWAGPDGILGTDDDVVYAVITEADGNYTFTGLMPGTYQITKINPANFTSLADADGGNPNNISLVLAVGEDKTDQDFEVQPAAGSIGDSVWLDVDRDGIQDIGEPGLANVSVALWSAGPDGIIGTPDDVLVAVTTTDLNGNYLFTDVPAGDYYVKVDTSTLPVDGLFETAGNNGSTSGLIELSGGESWLDADFGYVGAPGTAIIGDFVWSDANNDGLQDPGEPGIEGVTLDLISAGPDGVFGTADDVVVATATTAPDGSYYFVGVDPGKYQVNVTDTNLVLDGYSLTLGPESSTDPTVAITVIAGQSYVQADFGYYNPDLHSITDRVWFDADRDGIQDPGEAGIAGVTVNLYADLDGDGGFTKDVINGYVDINGDGVINADDDCIGCFLGFDIVDGVITANATSGPVPAVINGVPVIDGLLDINGDGVINDDDDGSVVDEPIIATAITNDLGDFAFTGLPDGDYVIEIADNSGQLTSLQGTTDDALAYQLAVTVADADVDGINFGYASLGPIGDTVFSDHNGNGIQDAGEPGIAGVTVLLYRDANGDGVFDPLVDLLVAITTTDATGQYLFDNLVTGTYFVSIDDGQAALAGYTATTTDQEPGDQVGSTGSTEISATLTIGLVNQFIFDGRIDINGDGVITAADDGFAHGVQVIDGRLDLNGDGVIDGDDAGWWNGIRVIGGELDVNGDGVITGADDGSVAVSQSVFLNADFGYQNTALADISGTVWSDPNRNAVIDSGETGFAGVTLALLDSNGNVLATTTTDAFGNYTFWDLPAGNYTVVVTDSAAVLNGTSLTSGLDAIPVTVTGTTPVENVDFGYARQTGTASIGDTVWLDANGDGLVQSNEATLSGVTVYLCDATSDPAAPPCNAANAIDSAVTDSNGNYLFSGLLAGNYFVGVEAGDLPANLDPTTYLTGTTGMIALSDGEAHLTADFGFKPAPGYAVLGDTVWYDVDGDGLQDAAEVGIGGVTVIVLDKLTGAVVATVVTNPDGSWLAVFEVDGTREYVVTVDDSTLPGGLVPTPTNMGGGDTYIISVKAGDVRLNLDFGYAGGLGASIGDEVFLDANDNGLWDPGEGLGDIKLTVSSIGIINGYIDINGDGVIDENDDGFYGGYAVEDGVLEAAANGQVLNGYTVVSDGLGGYGLDINGNGTIDANDDLAAQVLGFTKTDADGKYLFTGLLPGDYRVAVLEETLPAGVTQTVGTNGTGVITVAEGETYLLADFGYQPVAGTAIIGDRIWSDVNGDGVQDAGEVGLGGVTVYLCAQTEPVCDAGSALKTVVTSADGSYLFTNVAPGDYTVKVDPVTVGGTNTGDPDGVFDGSYNLTVVADQVVNTVDFGYQDLISANGSIGDTVYFDTNGNGDQDPGESGIAGVTVNLVTAGRDGVLGTSDDIVVATTITDEFGNYSFVGLPPGTYLVRVSDIYGVLAGLTVTQTVTAPQIITCTELGCNDIDTADFGYVAVSSGSGSIGDTVYFDTNGDGVQDAGEIGIPGVTLQLINVGPDGVLGGGDDTVVATTTTGADGKYSFSGLPEGTYQVVVTDTNNLLGNLTATQTSGLTTITCDAQTATCDAFTDVDFGYKSTSGFNGTLGGTVWHDTDQTLIVGEIDPGEPGLQGVTVALWLDTNNDGIIEPGVDNLVRTTTTDANGDYLFLGLPPGNYIVDVTDTSGVLAGMTSVVHPTDPHADGNAHIDPYPITLGLGEVNTSVDFGYAANTPYSISGTVFEDAGASKGTFNDPALGGDDALVAGAVVKLYRLINGVEYLVGTAVTDANGDYTFTDLPAGGTYVVRVSVAGTDVAGFSQTVDPDQVGVCTTCDSKTTVVNLSSDVINLNFGYWNGGVVTTPVTLSFFEATAGKNPGEVQFLWATSTEAGNVGFDLYVETRSGAWVRINEELIPAQDGMPVEVLEYKYFARNIEGSKFYIVDTDIFGVETEHGPFSLGKAYGVKNDGRSAVDVRAIQEEHVEKAKVNSERKTEKMQKKLEKQKEKLKDKGRWSSQNDTRAQPEPHWAARLAGGMLAALVGTAHAADLPVVDTGLLRIEVSQPGIQRVRYEDLKAAGLDINGVHPDVIGLTNRGEPVPLFVSVTGKGAKATFGPGSWFEFLGQPLDTFYTKTNVYNLYLDESLAVRAVTDNSRPGKNARPAAYYLDTVRVADEIRWSFTSPNGDPWYMTRIQATKPTVINLGITVDEYAGSLAPVMLDVGLWGANDWPDIALDHRVKLSFNGTLLADVVFDGIVAMDIEAEVPPGNLQEGANTLTVDLPFDAGQAFELLNIDSYAVTYPRKFKARAGQGLHFTGAAEVFEVEGLSNKDLAVYRSDSNGSVTRLKRYETATLPGGGFKVRLPGTAAEAQYWVATTASLAAPALAPPPADADITSGNARYLVIAHPDFIGPNANGDDWLGDLVLERQAGGLTTRVADVEQVYAQFSHGILDPQAIRDYIAYAYRNMGTEMVLLVGGDTFDYHGYYDWFVDSSGAPRYDAVSFIPTLYAPTGPIVNFAPVDPLYADVDGDSLPDLAIGRLPVRSSLELEQVIKKTLAWEQRDYGSSSLFVADNFDTNNSYGFKADAEDMLSRLPPAWQNQATRAYLDDLTVAGTRSLIINTINAGVALTSYVGHSDTSIWTFDGVFSGANARALTNFLRPTVVTQWGCWNTFFVTPAENTMGHEFLLNGEQGAAAVLGASTLTDAVHERELAKLVYDRLFQPGVTLGEAVLQAKRAYAAAGGADHADVILGWTLLGDPGLVVEQ